MRRFSGWVFILVLALLAAMTGTALAATGATELTIAQIRQNGGELYLYLTGVDNFGQAALETASVGDYTVSMNGKTLPVTAAEPFDKLKEKTHYIVCVDISASIGGKGFTNDRKEGEHIKNALRQMIDGLQSNEVMTLIPFGTTVDMNTAVKEQSRKSGKLQAAVDALQFNDQKTALYQVIYDSTSFAWDTSDRYDRSAVLIITDGTDDASAGSSGYTYEAILNTVVSRNVPVYTATFYRNPKFAENQKIGESLQLLSNLAAGSGGRLSSLSENEENDGQNISKLVNNLVQMTRHSTKLTTQLDSTMEQGTGTLEASMQNGNSKLNTPKHAFSVNWGVVPTPTPIPVLDLLEVDDITEDTTVISGITEPGATVTIAYNDKHFVTLENIADGVIRYDFRDLLNANFHLKKGDKITVSAVDADGNSTLPKGGEARVNKIVGESRRDVITVLVDGDGMVYGDKMTVRGTAQSNEDVLVIWAADDDPNDGAVFGPVKAKGGTYNITLNADDCVLGTGMVSAIYADYTATSRGGIYEGVVNWMREKPVELREATLAVEPVTEDSEAIIVKTEPGAQITLIYDGRDRKDVLERNDNTTADDNGDWSLQLKNSSDLTMTQNKRLQIAITCPDGRTAKSEPIIVGGSSRRDFQTRVNHLTDRDNRIYYGAVVQIQGPAQKDTDVSVQLVKAKTGEAYEKTVNSKGSFAVEFTAEECDIGEEGVDCYTVTTYADNLGDSKAYNDEVFTWFPEEPEVVLDLSLTVEPLNEDSEFIMVKTEPGARITLEYDGKDQSAALGEDNTVPANGRWEYPLKDNPKLILRQNKRLQVTVTSEDGRTAQSDPIIIGGSSRREFKTVVNHLADKDERIYYGETVQIRGPAEKDAAVKVQLIKTSTEETFEKTADSQGNFTVEFSAEECGIGDEGEECYTVTTYADCLASSRTYSDDPFTWYAHEPVAPPEAWVKIVNRLTEDSEFIQIETEPDAEVTIVNLSRDSELIDVGNSEDGKYPCPLGVNGKGTLYAGDEIQASIVDANGEVKTDSMVVGESRRADINFVVKNVDPDGRVNQESLVIQGNAEKDKEIEVVWQAEGSEPQIARDVANQYGVFTVTLDKESFTGGLGTIQAHYADGLAPSKARTFENGPIDWDQVTPPPTATPSPVPTVIVTEAPTDTPKPTATVTASPKPTVSPTPEPTEEPSFIATTITKITDFFGGPENMIRDWRFWAICAALLLLLVLIIVLIVMLARKHKKKSEVNSFRASEDIKREGALAEAGTERKKAPGNLGSTTRMMPDELTAEPSGTVNMSMGQPGMDYAPTGGGTVRLTAQDGLEPGSGTVRISMEEGPRPMMVRIHEAREWEGVSQDTSLPVMEEATIGRGADNDLVIQDNTVSGHHLKLIRKDNQLFALDLMSSNGTMLNGMRMTVESMVNSGDKLTIGRTVLTIEYDG